MKTYLYLCALISLIACNGVPQNSFKLEGFVEGAKDLESLILYYYTLKDGEWHEIADTTKIVNGKFVFTGHINELTAAELVFDDFVVVVSARIYLEPTSMVLQIDKNQPHTYSLSGTKVEKEILELRKELESEERIFHENSLYLNDLFAKIQEHDDPSVLDSLYQVYFHYRPKIMTNGQKMNEKRLDFIVRHNTYQIVPDLVWLITKQESFHVDTIISIYNRLPEQSKVSLMGKLAGRQIEYLESKRNSLIDFPAPDFTRIDAYGAIISLSEFKNKNFVLLDFWASWCAPCIEAVVGDNPKVKNLYDKYREKGLVIIGVSLDEDSIHWINTINTYKLDQWPQILSNLNESKSVFNDKDLSTLYDVQSVPFYILIDKQGKIMARWESIDSEQLLTIDRIINNIQ